MGDDAIVSRLYLIRHGETVDNVRGLYAGVRDSALTVHGVQQTRKLGEWLVQNKPPLTHLFSSDLSRAFRTAQAIRGAQANPTLLDINQQSLLQEQNFGALEGQPWTSKASGNAAGSNSKSEDLGPVESKEAMASRADTFLDKELQPLLTGVKEADGPVHVAIVSHGMMLSRLWKQLLQRLQPNSVTVEPELLARHQPLILEHLGGWSNTGYLELELSPRSHVAQTKRPDGERQPALERMHGVSLRVVAINQRVHLAGLKRARGGIGSSEHDDQQKTITSFFKKPKKS